MISDGPAPGSVPVAISDGQYHVEGAPGVDDDWPETSDGLFVGEDNWFAVLTGTSWGTVEMVVLQTDEAGEAGPEFDMVAERSLDCATGRLVVRELYADRYLVTIAVPPGWVRCRLAVRGRSEASAAPEQTVPPLEHHLLQFWPEDRRREPSVLRGPDPYGLTQIG